MDTDDKTKLTFRFTGEIVFSFDDRVSTNDNSRFEITEGTRIEIGQRGFPQSASSEFWVQALVEKQIEYGDNPQAYYDYLRGFCEHVRKTNGKGVHKSELMPDSKITASNPFGRWKRLRMWTRQNREKWIRKTMMIAFMLLGIVATGCVIVSLMSAG